MMEKWQGYNQISHWVNLYLGVVHESGKWWVCVLVNDRYNFDKVQYDGFAGILNDVGLYDQTNGYIVPYNIDIYADNGGTSLPYGVPTW
jgi:hypothetical protein